MRKNLLLVLFCIASLSQAQVSLVKDINPSGDGVALYSENRIEYNGELLFAANDGANGMELWKSDGTEVGTQIFNTTNANTDSGNPKNFYKFNGLVYYNSVRTNAGTELYATDGATSTVFAEINLFGNANPSSFKEFNNSLIFSAIYGDVSSNNYGQELFGFDGTQWSNLNDIFIKDINTTVISANSNHSSSPDSFVELNGLLLFSAASIANNGDRELWVSNGTNSGTNLLLDINVGVSSSNPSELIFFNNKIYFSADDGVNGRELWVTDGTVNGTMMVQDLFPNGSGNPTGLTVYNNFLIFTANNPSTGVEAFKMTASENITLLQNINPGSGSSAPFGYTVFNGDLYFAADNGSGIELWKSGGFPSNTNLLADINPSGESTPQGFTEYNGKLYFNADDGANGRELWVTDGTTSGTQLIEDIWTGVASSDPLDFIVAGDNLFFSASNGSTGIELFKYRDPSLSIDDEEINKNFKLYPNPSNTHFSIKTNYEIDDVKVYDIKGKLVKSFVIGKERYLINDLKSGLYFVKIKSTNGYSISQKLIKN